MIYRDSTAYDFDLFTDNKKREVVEIPVAKPAPKKAARTQPAARTFKQRAVAVCAVAAVLLLVVAQLHCQLVNSETVDQIGRAQKKIETLESEQTRKKRNRSECAGNLAKKVQTTSRIAQKTAKT